MCHDAVEFGVGEFWLVATGSKSTSLSGDKNWQVTDPGGVDPKDDPTLFVQNNGSDSGNHCSDSGSPCLTLQRAHDIAIPADIIELRTNGTGAVEVNQTFDCTRSGSAGNEIVVRVHSGDTWTLDPTGSNNAVFDFDGCCYWFIDGSVRTLNVGDRTRWSGINGGTVSYPYTRAGWFKNNSDYKFAQRRTIMCYNYFSDLRGHEGANIGTPIPQPVSSSLYNSTEYNWQYMNTFHNIRKWQEWGAGNAESGLQDNLQEYCFYNNIIAELQAITDLDYSFYAYTVHSRKMDRVDLQGHDNSWFGAIYASNMIKGSAVTVRMRDGTGTGTVSTLASAKSTWSDNWMASNNQDAATVPAAEEILARLVVYA